jgi:hypothetical protein
MNEGRGLMKKTMCDDEENTTPIETNLMKKNQKRGAQKWYKKRFTTDTLQY